MTNCVLIPAFFLILIGVTITIIGLWLCYSEYRRASIGKENLFVVIVGATLLCVGVVVTAFGAVQYAYLIPCITVIP